MTKRVLRKHEPRSVWVCSREEGSARQRVVGAKDGGYDKIATFVEVCACAEDSTDICFLLASAARVSGNGSSGTHIGGKARFPKRGRLLVSLCRDTLSTPSQLRMSLQSARREACAEAALTWKRNFNQGGIYAQTFACKLFWRRGLVHGGIRNRQRRIGETVRGPEPMGDADWRFRQYAVLATQADQRR